MRYTRLHREETVRAGDIIGRVSVAIDASLMLVHRLQRWTHIKPASGHTHAYKPGTCRTDSVIHRHL